MNALRISVFSLWVLAPLGFGETVKDREGAVRGDRAKMETSERWIYNDIDAGFAEAKKTGKPLMVVLRCVPCMACMGIDTEVLVENRELTPLMDRFVRVRVINANALDLTKFQFDYDLSFSTLFFNGDGTVYGRYGSWEHQHDPQNAATATFKSALEGALKIHEGYPANKEALAGKQGVPSRFRTPMDIPALQEKYEADLDWEGKVVQSCVHCHMIGSAKRVMVREARQPMEASLIYPHPAPETIGIEIDARRSAEIERVAPGSAAARAGLKGGDVLRALAEQPLISTADFSWVLHRFPDSGGDLDALVERGGKTATVKIALADGWREGSDISRRVGTWGMRAMAFGGMRFEELDEAERRRHGLAPDQLGLLAKSVGKYGKHAAARKAGWKVGDILVAIEGSDARLMESKLLGRLIQENQPGAKVAATILRGGKRMEMRIPIQ